MQNIYFLFFTFYFLLFVASCEKEKKASTPSSSNLTKTVLTSSKKGKKTWRLQAEKIRMEDKKTYLYHLKLELFKDDFIECTIVGDEGIINGDEIALSGNITANTNEWATLTTSNLIFDEKTNSLFTNALVSFAKKDLILRGFGFIADRSLNDVRIKKDVEVIFK